MGRGFSKVFAMRTVFMTKAYSVVFDGLNVSKSDFYVAIDKLGVNKNEINYLNQPIPVVVKDGISLKEARRYADVIMAAGGRVSIIEAWEIKAKHSGDNRGLAISSSFSDFVVCPECGFKQYKNTLCVRCGYNFF